MEDNVSEFTEKPPSGNFNICMHTALILQASIRYRPTFVKMIKLLIYLHSSIHLHVYRSTREVV